MDLFKSLDRAAKEDNTLAKTLNVTDLFSSWSNQAGAPLLIVKRNYVRNTIDLYQERYFQKYPHPDAHRTSYSIPYNFDTKYNVAVDKTAPDGWFTKDAKSLRIKPTANKKWSRVDWVLFNKQQTGYYRILYDRLNYRFISEELRSGDINKIHPYSRAQLLDDTKHFVNSGRLPPSILMDLTQYLSREREYAPWAVAEKYLIEIKRSLNVNSTAYRTYTEFVANLVKGFYEDYPLNSNGRDTFLDSQKRQIAVRLACEFGVEACLRDSTKSVDQLIRTGEFASPNTRGLIYDFGIRNANASVINSIWNRLQFTTNYEERQDILKCIGSITNESAMEHYLQQCIDSSIALTTSERTVLYTSIATNSRFGLSKAIELLKNKLDEGCASLALDKTLPALADHINSEDLKHEV